MEQPQPPIDPTALKPLMYHAGLALHSSQLFEYGIKLLLLTRAQTGFGKMLLVDSIEIIEDRTKRTLGQLLMLLQQHIVVSDEWAFALQDGLDARNEVVHRFFNDRVEQIVDPGTRHEALMAIKALRKRVLTGNAAAQLMIDAMLMFRGCDPEEERNALIEEVRLLNAPRT